MTEERLDVIIFGASGFTGKYTVFEGVKLLADLKWGVAGRNKEKLEKTLKEMGDKAKTDLSKIPIIIADVNDDESLKKMAEKCRIVVNVCGPYRFWGEAVVKACIEAGTHHIDVSGEPQYMERMQLDYHEKAKAKGVYILSACGFDSIPADMGVVFLQNHFEGTVNSVEVYVESWQKGGFTGGAGINYGTWHSAVYGLAHAAELKELRSKLFKDRLPALTPKLKERPVLHKSEYVKNKWCLPFLGADRSVVYRSQRYFFEELQQRPVQMKAYIAFGNLFATLLTAMVAVVFGLMAKFSFGRRLLLDYPGVFSLGFVSKDGPSEEAMENNRLAMHFVGKGWTEKLKEPTDQYQDPPNKILQTKVSGSNLGYGMTCVALLLSAKTILSSDKSKMAGNGAGGVYPPGAAFAKTNLISDLNQNGLKFEVVSAKEESKED